MTDRELLEAAARAAGMYVLPNPWPDCDGWFFCEKWERPALHFRKKGATHPDTAAWMPLDDDGDALRLAVKLCIDVFQLRCHQEVETFVQDGRTRGRAREKWGDNSYAATRRAIVRAAAAMAQEAKK